MLIAIDHGNKQMKTIHSRPFVSGLVESIARPFGSDIRNTRESFIRCQARGFLIKEIRRRMTAFSSLPCSGSRKNSI